MITRIVVTKNGRETTLTVKEWLAMPLPERVDHLGVGSVHFYDGAQKLTAREALAVLKAIRS
jgi:hypothetical protein